MSRSYRLEAGSIGPEEMGRVVGTTWKSMSPQEKAPYERVATDELERYMDAKRTFEALHRHYSTLHYGAQEAGECLHSAPWHVASIAQRLPAVAVLRAAQFAAGSGCVCIRRYGTSPPQNSVSLQWQCSVLHSLRRKQMCVHRAP